MRDLMLILHFVGLAMGVGTGFALLRIGFSTRNLSPAERGPLFQKISVLRLNAYTGLALLILSGLGLLWVQPGLFSAGGGFFQAKLLLVAVMLVVVGITHTLLGKAKRAGGPPPAILPKLGNLNFTLGLLVVALAVLAFH
jgi:uncharacterized membrane protein